MILTVTPNPCVDKTIVVDRLELGGPVRDLRYSCTAGGKGVNVSRAVRAMGSPTKAIVVVGGFTGQQVVHMIRNDDGVDCIPIEIESPTRTITTILERRSNRQTPLFEPGPSMSKAEVDRVVEVFRESIAGARVVTFNGTVPDPAAVALYATLIPVAREAGAYIILDSHGPEFRAGLAMCPDMIKPNVEESEEILGKPLQTESDFRAAVGSFHQMGVRLVVISRGKDGALVSDRRTLLRVTPPRIREVNAVGSGDALVAGFAIGLLESMSVEESARLAVAMGTANALSWDIGRFTADSVAAITNEVRIDELQR